MRTVKEGVTSMTCDLLRALFAIKVVKGNRIPFISDTLFERSE